MPVDRPIDMGIGGIPERLGFYELMRIRSRYGYEPAWLAFWEIMHHPDILKAFPNVTLSYHADRM